MAWLGATLTYFLRSPMAILLRLFSKFCRIMKTMLPLIIFPVQMYYNILLYGIHLQNDQNRTMTYSYVKRKSKSSKCKK